MPHEPYIYMNYFKIEFFEIDEHEFVVSFNVAIMFYNF